MAWCEEVIDYSFYFKKKKDEYIDTPLYVTTTTFSSTSMNATGQHDLTEARYGGVQSWDQVSSWLQGTQAIHQESKTVSPSFLNGECNTNQPFILDIEGEIIR